MATIRFVLELKVDKVRGATFKILGARALKDGKHRTNAFISTPLEVDSGAFQNKAMQRLASTESNP